MNFLTKINQTFGLTNTESRVILFLIVTFIIGVGLKIIKFSPQQKFSYNYTALDSEFAARSNLISISDLDSSKNTSTDSTTRIMRVNKKTKSKDSIAPKSININTATKEELMKLPGIGEVIADRIILYRKVNGTFSSIEDIMNVKGIGKKKFERLAPYVIVGK